MVCMYVCMWVCVCVCVSVCVHVCMYVCMYEVRTHALLTGTTCKYVSESLGGSPHGLKLFNNPGEEDPDLPVPPFILEWTGPHLLNSFDLWFFKRVQERHGSTLQPVIYIYIFRFMYYITNIPVEIHHVEWVVSPLFLRAMFRSYVSC